jgi:hypothetical protein
VIAAVACIVVAVIALGLVAGLAIVHIGSWLSAGSAWRIQRSYQRQRADLKAVLPDRRWPH